MIRLSVMVCMSVAATLGADDSWTKLQELKTGTELRVYTTGSSQPIAAQFGDATDSSLIIVVKNKQSALPKDQIDRIDYRPARGSKVKVESSTKTQDPPVNQTSPLDSHVPSTSYSTGITSGNKPDFEILYRKQSTALKAPANKPPDK